MTASGGLVSRSKRRPENNEAPSGVLPAWNGRQAAQSLQPLTSVRVPVGLAADRAQIDPREPLKLRLRTHRACPHRLTARRVVRQRSVQSCRTSSSHIISLARDTPSRPSRPCPNLRMEASLLRKARHFRGGPLCGEASHEAGGVEVGGPLREVDHAFQPFAMGCVRNGMRAPAAPGAPVRRMTPDGMPPAIPRTGERRWPHAT